MHCLQLRLHRRRHNRLNRKRSRRFKYRLRLLSRKLKCPRLHCLSLSLNRLPSITRNKHQRLFINSPRRSSIRLRFTRDIRRQ